jgi:hypothetical protein
MSLLFRHERRYTNRRKPKCFSTSTGSRIHVSGGKNAASETLYYGLENDAEKASLDYLEKPKVVKVHNKWNLRWP